jgi:predicted  nucleic acid-binding Zn-ribbon protein
MLFSKDQDSVNQHGGWNSGISRFSKFLLAGSFVVFTLAANSFGQPADDSDQQSRVVTTRDLLVRAEQRADELRARLFDLQSKEIALQSRIDDINYRMTPEAMQRALVFVSSVRPLDDLRAEMRAQLESERARVAKQLELVKQSEEKLEVSIREADKQAEQLRQRLNQE